MNNYKFHLACQPKAVKNIFFLTLFSFVTLVPPATAKPVGRCDDYVSYAITSTGRCVNLESFTKLAEINRRIVDLQRQITPLFAQKVRITEDADSELYFIEGEVYNQSRRTVKMASVIVDINGFAKKILVVGPIKPGVRMPFKHLTETRGTPTVIDVTAIE